MAGRTMSVFCTFLILILGVAEIFAQGNTTDPCPTPDVSASNKIITTRTATTSLSITTSPTRTPTTSLSPTQTPSHFYMPSPCATPSPPNQTDRDVSFGIPFAIISVCFLVLVGIMCYHLVSMYIKKRNQVYHLDSGDESGLDVVFQN